MKIGSVAKTIVAIIGAVVVPVQAAITDGRITPTEVGPIVVSALVALGVYVVPNVPYTRS